MKTLIVILLLFMSCVAYASDEPYYPLMPHERYIIGDLTVYFVTPNEWDLIKLHYFGKLRPNMVGLTTTWFVSSDNRRLMQIIYMPKVEDKINILTLGHEFAHVLSLRKHTVTRADDPDNCPNCNYYIDPGQLRKITELMRNRPE